MKKMSTSITTNDVGQPHKMITELYQQYQYEYITAIRQASKIQRELSRAEHEVSRMEQHLRRIEMFCEKNNVPLMNNE